MEQAFGRYRPDLKTSIESKDRRRMVIDRFFKGHVPESHNFRVTDSEVSISIPQQQQLHEISQVVPAYIDGIQSLSQLCLIDDIQRRKSPLYRRLRNCLRLGKDFESRMEGNRKSGRDVPDLDKNREADILSQHESARHAFAKIDLVQDCHGAFHIVELEVDKTHGFGYTALGRKMGTNGTIGEGLVSSVAKLSGSTSTGLIVSSGAEFYLTEASYFAGEVNEKGGNLTVVSQDRILTQVDGLYTDTYPKKKVDQVLAIPQLQTSNRGVRFDIDQTLRDLDLLEASGLLKYISKRNYRLSDKTNLAVISNPQEDPELEELLMKVLGETNLAKLRKYIPKTEHLELSKRHKVAASAVADHSDRYFVKEVNSSGSHGLAVPGDKEAQLKLIQTKPSGVIVQEKIEPAFHHLSYTDVLTGQFGEDDFNIRYILFTDTSGNILDLALTASPGLVAHGGKESILVSPKITDIFP